MNRVAWWATIHRVAKNWTQLKRVRMHSRTREGGLCGILYPFGLLHQISLTERLKLGKY